MGAQEQREIIICYNAGSEDGTEECRWPPEARKDNKMGFLLDPPEGTALLTNIGL